MCINTTPVSYTHLDVYKRQILGHEALQFTTVYVDDLLSTSVSWEDHCHRIEHVLRKLSENNIKARKIQNSSLMKFSS